jgi:iron complex outermembrane recepter protein
LANFFTGDPNLQQVVSHPFKAGLRSRLHPFEGATLSSTIAFYRSTLNNDILFVNRAAPSFKTSVRPCARASISIFS